MKSFFLYLTVILLTLIVCFPFMFPTRYLEPQLNSMLANQFKTPTQETGSHSKLIPIIGNIEGVLLNGSADVILAGIPLGNLSWRVRKTDLLTGNLVIVLHLIGDAQDLTATSSISADELLLSEVAGVLSADFINSFTDDYGIHTSGELNIQDMNLSFSNNWLVSLAGKLNWNGGIIRYSTSESTESYKLPALDGNLSLRNNAAALEINSHDSPTMSIELKQDGWLKISIRRLLFDLAGKHWIDSDSADDIVMTFEQKL